MTPSPGGVCIGRARYTSEREYDDSDFRRFAQFEWSVDACGFFFFQAEDGIRDLTVTGVQTCALPISERWERLEQLRPLLHGIPIGVALFAAPAAPGVDTADDLQYAETRLTRRLKEVSP